MFTSLFQLEQKPVTVYSSADPGAPALTAQAGSLKTLLKACLVTGYGSKPGLGWQMPFESADKNVAAFVSTDPKSSKFYFKIDNSGTNIAKLSGYQSMTDINAGVNPFVVDNDYRLFASSNWRLIGHSMAFVLLLDIVANGLNWSAPIVFGDLPKEKKRVEPLCVLWNGRSYASSNFIAGGVQSTLFALPDGYANPGGSTYNNYCYPFVVCSGTGGSNIKNPACRFRFDTNIAASVLYEPCLLRLTDSTWSLLPMLQPLSTVLNDVANLGLINANSIKARTGGYDTTSNNDCAVPIDWWYA